MTFPRAHSWWVLEAGPLPSQPDPRGHAPGHAISWPSTSPGPHPPGQTRHPLCSVSPPHARVPGSSATEVELGSQDLGLSGKQWAGRRQIPTTEGLCLPADGQAGLGCAAQPRGQSGANSLAGCGDCQGAGNNYRAELQRGAGSHTGRATECPALPRGPGFLGGSCNVCLEDGYSSSKVR